MKKKEVLKLTIEEAKNGQEKIFKTNIKIAKVKEPQKFVGKPGKNKLKKVGRNARRLIKQICKTCNLSEILVTSDAIHIKPRGNDPDPQLTQQVINAFKLAFRKKIRDIEIDDSDSTLPSSLLRSLNLE